MRISTKIKYKKRTNLRRNTITEMKNTLEGINRLKDAKEHISSLPDRVMESTHAGEQSFFKKLTMKIN